MAPGGSRPLSETRGRLGARDDEEKNANSEAGGWVRGTLAGMGAGGVQQQKTAELESERLEAELENELDMDNAETKDPIFRVVVLTVVAFSAAFAGFNCLSPYCERFGCCSEDGGRYRRSYRSGGKFAEDPEESTHELSAFWRSESALISENAHVSAHDEWSSVRAEWRRNQPLYEAQALTQNVGLVYPEVTQLNRCDHGAAHCHQPRPSSGVGPHLATMLSRWEEQFRL